jgi:branched-chain amino acid transport system substrate-binding protein
MIRISRRFFTGAALAAASSTILARSALGQSDPILIGVSGPLTGANAQYGLQWKQGFDLALDKINAEGGVKGRKVAYVFEDSQSDPRQAVAIAQKFVADSRILIELGDFSSPASMAASPIYQRGGLVQYGFTNSHPDFTKAGDFMWSPSVSQADEQPLLAAYAVSRVGLKRIAILHLNTDWGRTSKDHFARAAQALGAEIVIAEGYQPEERDFRSTLVRARDANPDGFALMSYAPDGALIVRSVRQVGLKQPIVAASSVYSPRFIELGGDAVEGVYTGSRYFPDDPRPEVREFINGFKAKFGVEPDAFNAYAFDAMNFAVAAIRHGGPDRRAIRDALGQLRDIPSVIFGKATFDPATRRVLGAKNAELIVKDGRFQVWDGRKGS